MQLVLLRGLPGSGKTTRAFEFLSSRRALGEAWVRINYDEIARDNPGIKPKALKAMALAMATEAYAHGAHILVDNTNLTDASTSLWFGFATAKHYDIRSEWLNTPIEECIRRDRERTGSARVGRAVIETMALHSGHLNLWHSVMDASTGHAIIVDMDGTLSDCGHRQHHVRDGRREWDAFYAKCDQDPVNEPVRRVVEHLAAAGDYAVFIVSGRPTDKAGIATEEWLSRHEVPYTHLFMRQRGDSRPDDEVKQDILTSIARSMPKSRIAFVLDDRNRVVDMWRRNGLPCFQVAPGDF